MGWWGHNVMEGDTPMDFEAEMLVDVCGIPLFDYHEAGAESFRKQIEENMHALKDYALNKQGNDDQNIAMQVLGVIIMSSGSTLSKSFRDLIVDAATHDLWAEEDQKRRTKMSNFITTIKSYDLNGGTPLELDNKGLFETIIEGMANESND